MSLFSRRYLLFNDHSCIGIFAKGAGAEEKMPNRLELVLSRSGDFVLVSRFGTEAEHHMTRFVPSDIVNEVKDLLQFRNRHTNKPFLCERFHGVAEGSEVSKRLLAHSFRQYDSQSDESIGEMSSASIVFDADISHACIDDEGQVDISRCPFGRRLQVATKALYYTDESLDVGLCQTRSMLRPALASEIKQVFPIAFAPSSLLAWIPSSEDDERKKGSLPRGALSSIDNGSEAAQIFLDLGGELSLLHDLEYYPAMSKRVALFEQVDSVTYALNGPEPDFVRATKNLSLEDLTVEAWFADEQRMLSLKGDYFYHYSMDGGKEEVHISLVDLTDEPCMESENGKIDIIDKFRALRRELVRLVTYRDYLESNRMTMVKMQLPGFDVKEGESMSESQARVRRNRSQRIRGKDITLRTQEAKFVAFTEVLLDPESSGLEVTPETHITRIQGTFLDHTIMSLDLASKFVTVLTPDRESLQFHLGDCLSREDQVAGDLLTAKYTKSSVRKVGPDAATVRHVRSIIAFYRWAKAPVTDRGAIIDHGRHVSKVAQAAALHSHRHLLLLKLRQGQINRESAASSTELLECSLNASGRDCFNGLTPYPYTSMMREIDGSSEQSRQNFVHSLSPKTVYSAAVSDPANDVHAHLHYTNMRNVAQEALKRTSSFLTKENDLQEAAQRNAIR